MLELAGRCCVTKGKGDPLLLELLGGLLLLGGGPAGSHACRLAGGPPE